MALVAVDIPSGLSADTGALFLRAGDTLPPADLTVTFHAMKPGHVLGRGPSVCGRVEVADIGLSGAPDGPVATLVGTPDPAALARRPDAHKYDNGHALVLSGPAFRTGAARLAARAALRAGAGLVTLGAPGNAMPECSVQLTAIMLREVNGTGGLEDALEDPRLSALCLGPALGTHEGTRLVVRVALRGGRPCVLDADALTAFADCDLRALFGPAHANANAVFTPHEGEFARIFPDLGTALAAGELSRIEAARQAAERAGAIVLLKGPATVIAAPDGRCAVNAAVGSQAVPWLATAGAGDVLSGFVCGLLARGLPPFDAACAAAWLHAEAARHAGPGLIAEDLPEALPAVYRTLGL